MTDQRHVVAGVDAHTDEHHLAVLDLQGRLLGAAAFPTTAAGYEQLIGWLGEHGRVDRVGVESTGAYAAGLVRERTAGIRVIEVNQPRTVQLFAVCTQSASELLVTAGQNIDRLHTEAAFARICGAAPIPASSGRTTRHRLDYGSDRQANRALHMIAVCRLRHCDQTRAYVARRTADGLNRREILRCLKRYIARQAHHTLRADLEALNSA
jgi:transposase